MNMTNKNDYKIANTEYYQAMMGIRRSGATTPYADKRMKRKRTRAAMKAYAIKDSMNY